MATKRLIDANAVDYENIMCSRSQLHWLNAIIEKQPTVDAVEVVHGRWIPLEYDGYADGNPVWDLWECSECQEEHSGDEDTLTPYCPNCGAKMDGDGNGSVEVVRCKDCKHLNKDGDCDIHDEWLTRKLHDFCSYGERKTDG